MTRTSTDPRVFEDRVDERLVMTFGKSGERLPGVARNCR
jgi:hypothetical protein